MTQTRPTGRDDFGQAGATGAVRTSGQLGPKSHSAVGGGEARSGKCSL